MTIEIRQITPVFAGEASGADLTRPQTADEVAAIAAGMDRYAVLIFRDQQLTDDLQRAFTRNFGTLEQAPGGHVTPVRDRRLPTDMQDASNLDQHDNLLARDDRRRMFNLGNRLWHSDSSFKAVPAKYSLLSARRIPLAGGNTEFADMRAAYDALDDETKAECENLICEHSQLFSRAILGFSDVTDDVVDAFRRLVPQLSTSAATLDAAALRAIHERGGSTKGRKGDVDALAATVLLQHALRRAS